MPFRQNSRNSAIVLGICGALALSFLISVPTHAQVVGATLSGSVTDASGSALPGAQLSIKNVATGVTRSVTGDAAGFYTAPNLLPGSYEITVMAPGFKTKVQSGVTLTVGAEQALNITMQVGEVTQKVQVTAEAPVVELASSAIGTVVSTQTVVELPLNGRDWAQLTNLNPGVSTLQTQVPNNAGAPRGNRGYGTAMTIAGTRPQLNNYRLDGISIVDYAGGSPASVLAQTLGVDAVAEFSVVTSNQSAEYGRTAAGVINAITKSGTNSFHGDAYWFLRDEGLDARSFFDPAVLPFHRNQFGGSLGGPIQKDKTFFFVNYEGFRQVQSLTAHDTVPSANARNGFVHDANGNITPIAVASQVQPFLQFWPLPNAGLIGNGDTGFANVVTPSNGIEDFVTNRIDRKFSEKDSIASSWFYDKATFSQPDPLDTVLYGNTSLRVMANLEETHIFSSSLLNNARVGYSRIHDTQNNPLQALVSAAGDTSATFSAYPGKPAPGVTINGGVTGLTGGLGARSFNDQIWNSIQFYDDVFLTKGVHALKFGFSTENMRHGPKNLLGQNGLWTFGGLTQFLEDIPSQARTHGADFRPGLRQTLFGGYIQDDWRFRPNLTLNLGLRYEPATVPSEQYNRIDNLRTITASAPTLGAPLFNNNTLRNFEPRIGFAWDPFRDGKTSVRGAFGIFDALPLIDQFFVQWSQTDFPYEVPNFFVFQKDLAQGSFPNLSAVPAANVPVTTPGSLTLTQFNPGSSYVMVWNLNVQRQITPGTSVTLGYVGNHGIRLFQPADSINFVIPQTTSAGLLWPGGVANGTTCVNLKLPSPCSLTGTGTSINPFFGTVPGNLWDVAAFYDALVAEVQKKFSHGFQIQGSYTWGKNIDNGSGATISDQYTNSIAALPWFAPQYARGLSDYNVAQKLTVNYIWDLPTPKAGGALVSRALGGWEVGGIINAQTGTPLTPVIAGDPLGTNAGSASILVPPNWLNTPGCSNPVNPGNVNNYVNVSCYSLPMATPAIASQCTPFGFKVSKLGVVTNPGIAGTCANLLGNAGRNTLIGPGFTNFDFSLFKNNRIGENMNLQFRAEFFNVLNRSAFQAPVNNGFIFAQDGTPAPGAGALDTVVVPGREIQLALKFIF